MADNVAWGKGGRGGGGIDVCGDADAIENGGGGGGMDAVDLGLLGLLVRRRLPVVAVVAVVAVAAFLLGKRHEVQA